MASSGWTFARRYKIPSCKRVELRTPDPDESVPSTRPIAIGTEYSTRMHILCFKMTRAHGAYIFFARRWPRPLSKPEIELCIEYINGGQIVFAPRWRLS